jgi:tRNA threonylcarbamoyladenosine biosynthesis protein TsaB
MILSIDTSTTVCSVALHDNGALLGCYELFTEKTSSAMLTTLAGELVRQAGHALTDLRAVAVAKGPGSYTGLRIGVSTAKGLCFALDVPLLSVNTLRAMTEQIRPFYPLWDGSTGPEPDGKLFCPMIDARRMEVYCAFYDQAGREVIPTAAVVIEDQSFADILAQRTVIFFGDGADKCRPTLSVHGNARFPDVPIRPSARTVGTLAEAKLAVGDVEDLAGFEPFYLKEFLANRPRKPLVIQA